MDYLFTCLLQIKLIDIPRNDVSTRTCYVSRQYFIHIEQYMELKEYDVKIKSNPIWILLCALSYLFTDDYTRKALRDRLMKLFSNTRMSFKNGAASGLAFT